MASGLFLSLLFLAALSLRGDRPPAVLCSSISFASLSTIPVHKLFLENGGYLIDSGLDTVVLGWIQVERDTHWTFCY